MFQLFLFYLINLIEIAMNYNTRITKRWNDLIRRTIIIPQMRRRLKNRNFTLLSNNCNGGFVYHDLGIRFNSPTINLFFYSNHFFDFLEHLDDYLKSELIACTTPQHKTDLEYPIFNIGGERMDCR